MISGGATSLGFTTPSPSPAAATSSAARSAQFFSFVTCVDTKPSSVCCLKRVGRYSCKVVLGSDSETSTLRSRSTSTSPLSSEEEENDADAGAAAKVGARIRVKVPLKFYHVPKVPEVDVTGMEGVIKQYVSFWKGMRIFRSRWSSLLRSKAVALLSSLLILGKTSLITFDYSIFPPFLSASYCLIDRFYHQIQQMLLSVSLISVFSASYFMLILLVLCL